MLTQYARDYINIMMMGIDDCYSHESWILLWRAVSSSSAYLCGQLDGYQEVGGHS